MVDRFSGAVVVITGGLGSLGVAMARGFLAEGGTVFLADNREEGSAGTIAKLGERARFAKLDVTDEQGWADAVARIEVDSGPITTLVNNAAYVGPGGIEQAPIAEWHKVLNVNVIGAVLGIRAVAPSMRKAGGGAIINVSSMAGLHATPGLAAYGASKWAIRSLTKTAAFELAPDNIRVNSLHPGIIETPLAYHPVTGQPHVPVRSLPISRNAEPEEIARYVLFMASDATFSTGSEFVADGGYALRGIPDQG